MAHRPCRRFIDPGLLAGGGRRIVGEAQHHQLQRVPLGRTELIKVGGKTSRLIQPQKARLGRGQAQTAEVGGIEGIEQERGIPGVQHRQGQMGRSLLGTHQKKHLGGWIHRHAKATLGPSGDRLPQRCRGAMQAIGGAGGIPQTLADRLNRHRRRLKIGRSQREIEQGGQPGLRPGAVGHLALVVAGKNAAA